MKTKEQKRQEGKIRDDARKARSDAEQLAIIATRRGESKKERDRIEARSKRAS